MSNTSTPTPAVHPFHLQTDQEGPMSAATPSTRSSSLPPRWFMRTFWVVQRAVYSVTRGRLGLRTPTDERWGMMRLRTVGRRSGQERKAIVAYFEDGADLVTMAMNGWADPEPAWWLNLRAQPNAFVDLPGGTRAVRARAADPVERPRLWARWARYDGDDLHAFAARRSRETAVVILSPRSGSLDLVAASAEAWPGD
jgi:F420H(2)-dependent quinone reductase